MQALLSIASQSGLRNILLAATVLTATGCTTLVEKSPEEMCRDMFDQQWRLAEQMLAEVAPGAQVLAPIAMLGFLRDTARSGYVEQCRKHITRADYDCVMQSATLGELLGKRCRVFTPAGPADGAL